MAGSALYVYETDEELKHYTELLDKDYQQAMNGIELQSNGVYVQASTIGSLEALISFLKQSKIPV